MAECGKYLGRGTVTFPCPLDPGHDGPCATVEVPRTMKEREQWEAEQRHQASGLGEFQGRAQTTAERYTEGATEPPGSKDPLQELADALDPPAAPAPSQRPTRADREHDQALPTPNDRPAIQDLVIADIERRKKVGLERYGTLLQPFNGRDSLLDLYDELLDAVMYVRQVREQDDQIITLARKAQRLLDPAKPFTDTPAMTEEARDAVLVVLDDLIELLGV